MKFYRTGIEALALSADVRRGCNSISFPALITVFPVCPYLHKTFTLLSQRSARNGKTPDDGLYWLLIIGARERRTARGLCIREGSAAQFDCP